MVEKEAGATGATAGVWGFGGKQDKKDATVGNKKKNPYDFDFGLEDEDKKEDRWGFGSMDKQEKLSLIHI